MRDAASSQTDTGNVYTALCTVLCIHVKVSAAMLRCCDRSSVLFRCFAGLGALCACYLLIDLSFVVVVVCMQRPSIGDAVQSGGNVFFHFAIYRYIAVCCVYITFFVFADTVRLLLLMQYATADRAHS